MLTFIYSSLNVIASLANIVSLECLVVLQLSIDFTDRLNFKLIAMKIATTAYCLAKSTCSITNILAR